MRIRKSNATLEQQYILQGSCCCYCKRPTPYELITKDHIAPVCRGSTLVKNKVYACVTCNSYKGSGTFEDFRLLMIKKSRKVLKEVASQGFQMSQEQLDKIHYFVAVINTVTTIIENGNKPEIVFT